VDCCNKVSAVLGTLDHPRTRTKQKHNGELDTLEEAVEDNLHGAADYSTDDDEHDGHGEEAVHIPKSLIRAYCMDTEGHDVAIEVHWVLSSLEAALVHSAAVEKHFDQ
jgi:hypothetical protein